MGFRPEEMGFRPEEMGTIARPILLLILLCFVIGENPIVLQQNEFNLEYLGCQEKMTCLRK